MSYRSARIGTVRPVVLGTAAAGRRVGLELLWRVVRTRGQSVRGFCLTIFILLFLFTPGVYYLALDVVGSD